MRVSRSLLPPPRKNLRPPPSSTASMSQICPSRKALRDLPKGPMHCRVANLLWPPTGLFALSESRDHAANFKRSSPGPESLLKLLTSVGKRKTTRLHLAVRTCRIRSPPLPRRRIRLLRSPPQASTRRRRPYPHHHQAAQVTRVAYWAPRFSHLTSIRSR